MSIVPRDSTVPVTALQWAMLRGRYPSVERLDVCWRLARDLQTCEALWQGRPVDAARLDPVELVKAREATLVQLVAPIDLLAREAV